MMNDEKREALRKDFADVIKSGAEGFLADSPGVEALTDAEMEALGLPLPPADMLARVKRACAPERPRRALRRAVVAAAALAAAVGAAFSVHAVRTNIWNTVVREEKQDVKISYANYEEEKTVTEEELYRDAEADFGAKPSRPMYMPLGFRLDEFNKNGNFLRAVYCNGKDGFIEIKQEMFSDSGKVKLSHNIDAARRTVETITVKDCEITFISFLRDGTDEQWYDATWIENNIYYDVTTNVSEGSTKKVIKGLFGIRSI